MAKTATKPKRSTGRPKAVIDWNQVGKLLEAGGSAVGIAAMLGIDVKTLYNRCETDNKITFSAYSQQKLAKGDELLRSKQFQVAMAGDKTMLIWLGKQRLNQSDKSDTNITADVTNREVRAIEPGE